MIRRVTKIDDALILLAADIESLRIEIELIATQAKQILECIRINDVKTSARIRNLKNKQLRIEDG